MNKPQNLLDSFLFSNESRDHAKYPRDLPRITIVTPSFNQMRFLERTIVSVIKQDYPNLEYIIIDGGSTDGSVEIIEKYESYLTYWESEPDEGQSHAIVKGFHKASGDILAWLNSDDVYWPDALWNVADAFMRYRDVNVIYGNSFTIDVNDKIVRETRSVSFSKWAFLTKSFSLHQASIFWRKTLYDSIEGIDIDLHLAMDRDLWFQFFKAGANFKHLNKTLSCYRAYDGTKTSVLSEKSKELCDQALRNRLGVNPGSVIYHLMRSIMRLRTFCLHIFNGNWGYILKSAGRKS